MSKAKFYTKYNVFTFTSWAAPCKKLKIQTFKPNGTQVDNQYNLNLYERNVQVSSL